MTADNGQAAIIAYLMEPSTHGGAAVERIDTHISVVFLAGPRVLKLKRAVRFDYLDYSTPALRRQACEMELRINMRTAPSLYHRVVAVTREADGALALGGPGTPEDWVVEMARFDQEALFDRLAARRQLDLSLMRPLASAVARLHAIAERRPDHGGAAGMRWVVEGNHRAFQTFADLLDPSRCARLTAAAMADIDRHAALLDSRRQGGSVRQCHGDLHLRNIVLLDEGPTLFDAIEFNDAIACVDVLYDLAFLLMDLWRRQLRPHANEVLNGYLAETGDIEGLPLLPCFLSCRAAVRAKTSATAARMQPDAARGDELSGLARDYLDMATELLDPPPPRLAAIGGVSGTGKSTLARALAPSLGAVPGAIVLRSDEIRKALAGVASTDRLGAAGYTEAMNTRVYEAMSERADTILRAGHSVILDAVHGSAANRGRVEAIATAARVPFTGIWLDAPDDILVARVGRRRGDPSDADASVVRRQRAREMGTIGWHRLDASNDPDAILERARAVMRAGVT